MRHGARLSPWSCRMITIHTKPGGRVLHFDIENAPLTYYAPDYPTSQITAIASAFADDPQGSMHACLLGETDIPTMLRFFVERYNEAEIVSGHYVIKHDLPIINAMLIEHGMDPLSPKLVSDTKQHLVKFSDLPKNQEFLLDLFGTETHKYHMTQYDWRQANRFTLEGLDRTRKRVTSDVQGHIEMRKALLDRRLISVPKEWK